MAGFEKLRHIGAELKGHAPFTTVGALLGIAFMIVFHKIGKPEPETLFVIFHPAHVLLSAMVTASIFRIHENKKKIIPIILIGYFGSIGVATLSDCVLPFIGEKVLRLDIPKHSDLHVINDGHEDEHAEHEHDEAGNCVHEEHKEETVAAIDEHEEHEHDEDGNCVHDEHKEETVAAKDEHEEHEHDEDGNCLHEEHKEETVAAKDEHEEDHDEHAGHDHGHGWLGLHLGFIEEWYIVNPAAALGIFIAFLLPRTKSPHALHVLISTWATSAHMLMKSADAFSGFEMLGAFVVLFIAVWLPCCVSDIIFPLLFARSDLELTNSCVCSDHSHHSHKHTHHHTEECGGDGEEA